MSDVTIRDTIQVATETALSSGYVMLAAEQDGETLIEFGMDSDAGQEFVKTLSPEAATVFANNLTFYARLAKIRDYESGQATPT